LIFNNCATSDSPGACPNFLRINHIADWYKAKHHMADIRSGELRVKQIGMNFLAGKALP